MLDTIVLRVNALAYGGNGVARTEPDEQGRRTVVFVTGGLPGELVEATITVRKPSYLEARAVRVLESSPERVDPPCPYFAADGTACGGCQWQHLNYDGQIRWKRAILVEHLQRQKVLLQDEEELVQPAFGMGDPWAYRSSVRFARRGDGALGYRRGSSHTIIAVDHCPIIMPGLNEVLTNPDLRPEVPVARQENPELAEVQYAARVGDDGTRTVLGISDSRAVNPADEDEDSLLDQADISRRTAVQMSLLGESFRVSAGSFFQVNTRQEAHSLPELLANYAPDQDGYSLAEVMCLAVVAGVQPQGDDVVLDAYSGVGTFALLLSPLVRGVYAIEANPLAYGDATHNTLHRKNIRLFQDQVEKALPRLVEQNRRVDKVILDPPRSGCSKRVLEALLQLRPLRIVYASCNPATLARDLRVLTQGGYYKLKSVFPLDMFPQSYHIESVATLEIPEELL